MHRKEKGAVGMGWGEYMEFLLLNLSVGFVSVFVTKKVKCYKNKKLKS